LPKSRSIEIANSKNGLPSVPDVRAGAKPKFRRRYHGCLNWLAAAARFLQRIFYTKRAILPPRLSGNITAGRGAMTRDRNDAAGAGNSPTMSRW